LCKNHARSLIFDVLPPSSPAWMDRAREGATIYIRCVSAARRSAQNALRSAGLRHPIFGTPRVPEPSEDLLPYLRFARPLSPGNKVNQPVFRYYVRACILGGVKEKGARRGGQRGTPFLGRERETSTKDTHNTAAAQFCGRGRAVGPGTAGGRLLSSLLNNALNVEDTW